MHLDERFLHHPQRLQKRADKPVGSKCFFHRWTRRDPMLFLNNFNMYGTVAKGTTPKKVLEQNIDYLVISQCHQ